MFKTKYFTDAKIACDYQPHCVGFFDHRGGETGNYEGFVGCYSPIDLRYSPEGSIVYIQPGK